MMKIALHLNHVIINIINLSNSSLRFIEPIATVTYGIMETDVEEPTFFMRKEREITRLDLFCVYFNNNSKFKRILLEY